MKKKYYVHNIFIINLKWLVVIDRQKNNFSSRFKLESIITYRLEFIAKILCMMHFSKNNHYERRGCYKALGLIIGKLVSWSNNKKQSL